MFVLCVPGLAPLAARELSARPGVTVRDQGFDGRSDVLLVDADGTALLDLRLAEDVFVEVGRTRRAEGDQARWIADRIWRPERVGRALSAWVTHRGRPRRSMTFRVIARVLQEHSFLRTDLRRELGRAIARDRPGWRAADPAGLEVWITEYTRGSFVAGLRLSDERMRQHDGRAAQRPGALRPTVAAALVSLAGSPDGLLCDPCCGSGTVLAEALAVGWRAWGADVDPVAVDLARANAPGADLAAGDAHAIDLPDGAAGACVSNLPFGRRFAVPGDARAWLRGALAEMARVTRPGGRVVVLVPDLPGDAVPDGLTLAERHRIRLLGTSTTIWALSRVPSRRSGRGSPGRPDRPRPAPTP